MTPTSCGWKPGWPHKWNRSDNWSNRLQPRHTTTYFLPIPDWERKLEVVGRVGGVSILSGGQEGTWEYAGGLNYYIDGQNAKLQTDVTKITELPISSADHSSANVNDDALTWRVQLQLAF